jgi:hypothetical protein
MLYKDSYLIIVQWHIVRHNFRDLESDAHYHEQFSINKAHDNEQRRPETQK